MSSAILLFGIPRGSRRKLLRYEQLVEGATELEVDGLHVLAASLDDIIGSKEIVDRLND